MAQTISPQTQRQISNQDQIKEIALKAHRKNRRWLLYQQEMAGCYEVRDTNDVRNVRDDMNHVGIDAEGIPRLVATSNLVGCAVENHNGEDLGEVREVMLDAYTGRVSYAVLSFGGFLGMGTKLFAVPWTALMFDSTKGLVVLHVEKDCLKQASGFDKDTWPSAVNPSWWEETQFHFRANS